MAQRDDDAPKAKKPANGSLLRPREPVAPRLTSPLFAQGSNSWTDVLPKTDHVDLFRHADFGATSLGLISDWGPALRLYATMVFSDSRPANVYWGMERIAFYNEKFAPLLAEAHPNMMGKSLKVGLPTVWDDTSVIFDHVVTSGRTVDVDDISFFVVRKGRLEETYFLGQFIPLRGDSGEIEGFYNTVYESTGQVLHERRRRVIDRIASIPPCPVDETLAHIVGALHGEPKDIPMALLYSYDEFATSSGNTLRLCGRIGVPSGHQCAPQEASLESADTGMVPFFRQAEESGAPVLLSQEDGKFPDTGSLFEEVTWCGYGEASQNIAVLSLKSGGRTLGFFVQGINPRRPYDEDMERSVVDMARQIEAKWGSSISAEEAKLRQEMLERKLTDSERRARLMAQSAPLGMCQIAPDATFEWANDQFYEITGFKSSESTIAEFLLVIHPDHRERALADLGKLTGGQKSLGSELPLARKWSPPPEELHEGEDASDISAWILTTSFPVYEDGKVKMVMGYVTDISRQKWAESVQTRNAAAATLAKRRQEEFIDTTSHEMRNPLSAITQLADGIAKSLDGTDDSALTLDGYRAIAQDNVASANTILACAAHQKRVIDDVLILSRLESEMLSITPVAERPSTVVSNVVRMFSGEAAMNRIEIEAVRDSSYDKEHVGHVLCDTSRLTQILINLISNAIKFTSSQDERKISVLYGAQSVRPPRCQTLFGELKWIPPHDPERVSSVLPALKEGEDTFYLYFCVQDTGPGLKESEIERLFKRFSQASSRTHIAYGGSGLGLYICRELAEKQGGQVGVASRRGEGSMFAFYIETRRAEASELELEKEKEKVRVFPTPPVTMVADRPSLPRRASSQATITKAAGGASLPVRERAMSPPQTPLAQLQANGLAAAASVAVPRLHIMVVEDNLVNQKVLAAQLRKAKCAVTVANHGLEALELLKKSDCWREEGGDTINSNHTEQAGQQVNGNRPRLDVILMDWEMPVMNGLACTKRIRQLEHQGQLTRRLPVIATTANVRGEQMEQALAAGMDSVMPKPFTVIIAPSMPTPDDCVQSSIIRSPTAGSSTSPSPILIATPVPKSALNDRSWIIAPLCAKLGVPLKIKSCQLAESQTYNYSAQVLMLEPAPEDAEFGMSVYEQLKGDALVVRADKGQHMGLERLPASGEELSELRSFWRSEHVDHTAEAREVAAKLISPEVFDAYRKRF
ncbi:hypothetical protein LTR85_011395 [Meristemomyces frigidus]|nr:hypothetical protein LTR85_011395 [Meristemomyces frigidus]